MQFHKQCDYLLRFQVERRISKSILLRKWMRNASNAKDDAYETKVFTYNRELDVLIWANFITRIDVEEESSPPYIKDVVRDLEEETTNLVDTTPTTTPQFAMNFHELNDHQWHPTQLNMFETKFGDAFEINNNCKAQQEKLTNPCR